MRRMIMKALELWFEEGEEKILFIKGPVGVGKSWLINKLCGKHGTNCIIFDDVNKMEDIENIVSVFSKIKFGKIKERIVISGRITDRLFGREPFADKENIKYIEINPLNFCEVYDLLRDRFGLENEDIYKTYMIIGGMPEIMAGFLEDGNLTRARRRQIELVRKIIDQYNFKNSDRIKAERILASVSKQMLSDSTGFSYRQINENARPREYDNIFNCLINQGIIYKSYRFDAKSHKGMADCKLRVFDIGLQGALAEIDENIIYEKSYLMDRQFVANFLVQEIISYGISKEDLMYWYKPRAKAKLMLVMREDEGIVPVEILAQGGKKSKSIESFMELYDITKVIRITDHKETDTDLSGVKNIYGENIRIEYGSIINTGKLFGSVNLHRKSL